MRDRTNKICNPSNKSIHLDKVFQANGYPKPVINRFLNRHQHRQSLTDTTTTDTTTTDLKLLFLPYIQGVDEKIERGMSMTGCQSSVLLREHLKTDTDESEEQETGRAEKRSSK